jgi:hypothetical protein
MTCAICDRAQQLHMLADVDGVRTLDVIGRALCDGIAAGFNMRKDVTYVEYCREHAELLKDSLKRYGSHQVPITSGGSG